MADQLSGHVAVVTGASAGIGRAVVTRLAADGATVWALARRKSLLDELAHEVAATGGRVLCYEIDLAERDQLAGFLDRLGGSDASRVSFLVNAAGGSVPAAINSPDHVWARAMELNFTAVRRLASSLLPDMIERGFGRVINLSGTSEPQGLNAAQPAKAALHIWSKGMSRLVAPHGVTVNCVAPGRVRSEQIARLFPDGSEVAEQTRARIPAGRFGTADEVAAVVRFLVSAEAGYITGEIVHVDGGLRMNAF